jgi:hypothetical protein
LRSRGAGRSCGAAGVFRAFGVPFFGFFMWST